MTQKIYLCGPIMAVGENEAKSWRETAKWKLSHQVCLDPIRRNFRDDEIMSANEIVEFCLRDIDEADIILVNYCKPSIGTSMEVFRAAQLGKCIIAFTHLKREEMSAWMVKYCTRILPSLDDAVKYIDKHFGGLK